MGFRRGLEGSFLMRGVLYRVFVLPLYDLALGFLRVSGFEVVARGALD